jgi:hypothetical protein
MKNPAQTLGVLVFVAPLIVISWLPGVRRFAVEHTNASMFAWGSVCRNALTIPMDVADSPRHVSSYRPFPRC